MLERSVRLDDASPGVRLSQPRPASFAGGELKSSAATRRGAAGNFTPGAGQQLQQQAAKRTLRDSRFWPGLHVRG